MLVLIINEYFFLKAIIRLNIIVTQSNIFYKWIGGKIIMNYNPSYFDESKVGTIYPARHQQVVDEAGKFMDKNKIKPSSTDKYKIALFMIDIQNSFSDPDGSLFVPGAVEDNTNIIKFLYKNIDKITECIASMDTHLPFQIFNSTWWIDTKTGKHPEPMTLISSKDINDGKYKPLFQPEESLKYCEELERLGKKTLLIWPFHTMLGSVSHCLNSSIYEAILAHSTIRQSQPNLVQKGSVPNSENYSVFAPEIERPSEPNGEFNESFFNSLMDFDRIYICGEAKSHCVMETLQDINKKLKGDKESLSKFYLMEDCTSPVPAMKDDEGNITVDFPRIADEAFNNFKKAGMNVIKSSEHII